MLPMNEASKLDTSPKKNIKPTADGKNTRHLTDTGKVERILEERELRKLEQENHDEIR